MVKYPMQGDIILLDTAPRLGHEQTGKRPYIVLSHQLVAEYSRVVIVAPISQTKRDYPLYIDISEKSQMKTRGKVMLDQVMTIDYEVRKCVILEAAESDLVDEVLLKIKPLFQKNS